MKTKINRTAAAYLLAVKLDAFAEEYDTYDYYDVVENRETVIREIANALLSGSEYLEDIKAYLQGIIDDDRWYVDRAYDLLRQINEFALQQLAEKLDDYMLSMGYYEPWEAWQKPEKRVEHIRKDLENRTATHRLYFCLKEDADYGVAGTPELLAELNKILGK